MVAAALRSSLIKRFPGVGRVLTEAAVEKPATHLNELRSQIWRLRGEFWYRKISGYPAVVDAAKVEANQLVTKLKQPAEWTGKDLVTGVVCGLQCYGAFVIGECVGKDQNTIIGYIPNQPVPYFFDN